MKDISQYLHLYLGCECIVDGKHKGRLAGIDLCQQDNSIVMITVRYNDGMDPESWDVFNDDESMSRVKPMLRPLSDAKEEDIIRVLLSEMPHDMEDTPDADEWDLEMFYNDDGNMVDGDIVVGANYSCRCYVGQIAIKHNGTILHYGEDGELARPNNSPAAFHTLMQLGFDLFGLIDAGFAIASVA